MHISSKGHLLALVLTPAFGQPFSIGAKGGLPLNTAAEEPPCSVCRSSLNINRYTVGLTGEVRLPIHFAIETDLLIKRLHSDYSEVTFHSPVGTTGRVHGYSWEFPLLLKYYVTRPRVVPFVDAGAALRRVGRLHGSGTYFDGFHPRRPVEIDFDPTISKPYEVGITSGLGISIRKSHFRFTPEIRYTRWTALFYQPAKNQIELLLGITFP